MPKKPTSYAKSGKGKSNPLNKESTPMKSPTISTANPMKGDNTGVASMPGTRFPKLTKPAVMKPRTPRI